MLKALFLLKILKLLSRIFGLEEKQLDKNAKINFKIYDDTNWVTNNYNTHIAQYIKK